jgi:hypothetical protein
MVRPSALAVLRLITNSKLVIAAFLESAAECAALGHRAEPSHAWNTREREAWPAVLAIADASDPLSFIDVDPLLANPAIWTGHLDYLLAGRSRLVPVRRRPAVPYPDLPAFLTALRIRAGVSVRALEFLILTVARTWEICCRGRGGLPRAVLLGAHATPSECVRPWRGQSRVPHPKCRVSESWKG